MTPEIIRQRYICSHKTKTGCLARLIEDTDGFNQKQLSTTGTHNHQQPDNAKIDPQTRAEVRAQLQTGVKISKLHTQWLNNHPDSVVTKKQMQNIRSYDSRKSFQSSDHWFNLQTMFQGFLRVLTLVPTKFIILVPEEAISILKDKSCSMFVDGTFALIQYNLTVTTVLYQVE